jgi:hypothetical protein
MFSVDCFKGGPCLRAKITRLPILSLDSSRIYAIYYNIVTPIFTQSPFPIPRMAFLPRVALLCFEYQMFSVDCVNGGACQFLSLDSLDTPWTNALFYNNHTNFFPVITFHFPTGIVSPSWHCHALSIDVQRGLLQWGPLPFS